MNPLSQDSVRAVLLAYSLLILPLAATASGGSSSSSSAPKRDPQPFFQAGLEQLKSQRYAEAQSSFKQVLSIVPDNAQANLLMGMAMEGQQDFKNAARVYKKAVRGDRELYEARARLGITQLKLGERGDAQEQLTELEKAGADCASGCAPEKQAQIRSAIELLKAQLVGAPVAGKVGALSQTPTADAAGQRYSAAIALINAARYEDAIASLREDLATTGPTADVLNYLGYAYRKLQRYEEAQSYYQQALVIAPLHLGANEYLGELYIETGRLDLAVAQLAKLQQLCDFGCIEEEELRRWLIAAR